MRHSRPRCLLIAAFLFFTASAYSQLTVFAGPQLRWAKYAIRGADQKTESKMGFMAGVGLKTQVEGPVYFAPQLYYSQKGYKVTFDRPAFPPDSAAKNNDVTVHAIELAPLIQVNFSHGASYGFFRVGPAFDVAVSGTEAFDSTGNKRISRNMKFDFGNYSIVTINGNVQLGYQHQSGLVVVAQYSHGMTSLNNADYGPTIFHRLLGISVGWKFGQKR